MKSFNNKSFTAEEAVEIKNLSKRFPNKEEIQKSFKTAINDTYIAIDNLEEAINSPKILSSIIGLIQNEDTSFAIELLGTTEQGNNNSHYRAFFTIDGKAILEIRIANHYETETAALNQSNNVSQYLFQVVLITNPPKEMQDNSISANTTVGNLKVLTRKIISNEASIEEVKLLLASIHDYLICPDGELLNESNIHKTLSKENTSESKSNKHIIKTINETQLKQIVAESIKDILDEGTMNKEQIPFDEVQGLLDSGVEPEDIFQWFYRFNNGFARVQLNGKYNFIDKNGKLLSNTWFDNASNFSEGFARVELNGKYNFIDKNGNLYDGKPSIQENRSPIKITESDIRMMVSEAVERLLN